MEKKRQPRVLDVGQCALDHGNIRKMVGKRFDAAVDQAHTIDEAVRLAESGDYDLVLVNRILDRDGAEGLELVKRLQANGAANTPVMLVSNYEDAQRSAVAAGAVPGFGKADLHEPASQALLAAYLT